MYFRFATYFQPGERRYLCLIASGRYQVVAVFEDFVNRVYDIVNKMMGRDIW